MVEQYIFSFVQVENSGTNKYQKKQEMDNAKKEKDKKKLELDELNVIGQPIQIAAKGHRVHIHMSLRKSSK